MGQVAVLALLLLTAACDLRLAVDVGLDGRGGGELQVVLEADRDLVGQAAAVGADPLARLAERVDAVEGSAWAVEVVELPDGGRQVVLRTGFADAEEFAGRWDELRGALDGPEARLLGPLRVVLDEEASTITVDGEVPLVVGEVAAADRGTTVEALTAELAGVVGATLTIRSPGPLVAGADGAAVTAEEGVDPRESGPVVLTWTVTPGQVAPVQAVLAQPEDGLAGLLVRLAVGLLAVVLIAGGVVAQRAAGRRG